MFCVERRRVVEEIHAEQAEAMPSSHDPVGAPPPYRGMRDEGVGDKRRTYAGQG